MNENSSPEPTDAKPRKKSKSANQRFPATGAATVFFPLYLRFITQRPRPIKRTAREKFLNPEPSFLRRRFSPPRFVIPYFLFDET